MHNTEPLDVHVARHYDAHRELPDGLTDNQLVELCDAYPDGTPIHVALSSEFATRFGDREERLSLEYRLAAALL